MSYDLFFQFRPSARPQPVNAFRSYFQARKHYQCSDAQAWYANETTGVYFSFDLVSPDELSSSVTGGQATGPIPAPVSFNLNYMRPHTFGLEAEPELSALVAHFNLLVFDPQNDGMGEGEYSSEGFLRGWNSGNRFGYRSMAQDPTAEGPFALPAATIEKIWRWNYTRDDRQAALGGDVFLPRIFYFDVDGRLCTGVAWGDLTPILLPPVDIILAPRKTYAPRRFLRKKEDVVLFRRTELDHLLRVFPTGRDILPYRRVSYETPPADLEKAIRAKSAHQETVKAVPPDQVLDQELLDSARGRGP